jgi:hypothetical protein
MEAKFIRDRTAFLIYIQCEQDVWIEWDSEQRLICSVNCDGSRMTMPKDFDDND